MLEKPVYSSTERKALTILKTHPMQLRVSSICSFSFTCLETVSMIIPFHSWNQVHYLCMFENLRNVLTAVVKFSLSSLVFERDTLNRFSKVSLRNRETNGKYFSWFVTVPWIHLLYISILNSHTFQTWTEYIDLKVLKLDLLHKFLTWQFSWILYN